MDLGTVLNEHKAAAARKGGKGKAFEVRPKRRAPISQVPAWLHGHFPPARSYQRHPMGSRCMQSLQADSVK